MAISSLSLSQFNGMGRMSAQHFWHLGTELIYAAIIIAICLIIIFKTKEIYKLSGHKGILYFRQTFFFFALAYFFRLAPALFKLSDIHPRELRFAFQIGFFLFSYASSMAILSLIRSISWKKITSKLLMSNYFYYTVAFILSGLIFISNDRLLFFLVQTALIILAFFITYFVHVKLKKKTSTHLTYLLLQLFWLLNLAIISVPRFMTTLIYILYALSIGLFVVILHKVLRRRS